MHGTKINPPALQPNAVQPSAEKSGKTTKVENMKASREREAVGKLAMIFFGFVLLIALIVGGVWFYITGKEKDFSRTPKKPSAALLKTPEKQQEPSNTPLTAKADEILKYVAETAGSNPGKAVELCEEFFRNFPVAKYSREKGKYEEINKVFHENDERLTILRRQTARERFLRDLENEREAAMRRRQDAERRERERREREHREKEKRRLAELKRQKDKEELRELESKIAGLRSKICIELVDSCSRDDYDSIRKLLEEAINLNSQKERRGKSSEWIAKAARFAGWSSRRRNWLNHAEAFRNILRNGSSDLKRPQIVYKGSLGYVTSIRNGIATAEDGGKTFTVDLKQLSRSQHLSFVMRLSNKMGNQQKAFYYMILGGNFNPPQELMLYNSMKRDLDEITSDYFKEKYKKSDLDQKKEMIRKYGKSPIFRKAVGLKPLGS